MAKTKKMNESYFAEMQKELTAVGELIRARQEEKQALMDEFDAESKRFFFGKLSERALASSVKKTNKELSRLDNELKNAITRAKKLSDRIRVFAASQYPLNFKATLSGIEEAKKKKMKVVKKKVKKKVAKKSSKKKKVKQVKKRTVKKAKKKK